MSAYDVIVIGARQAVTGTVDAPAVFKRRDEWVTDWNDEGQATGLKSTGAELIRGHGRLDGHRRVAVATPDGGTVTLTARQAVVICTGSRPALPELAGLAEARPWTNRHATGSRTVPGRLAIVGGVGVEMASAWQGLGSQVTLLAQADGLLARMEPFAGELVGRGLAEAGVDVRIGVTVTAIRRPGGAGPVTLTLSEVWLRLLEGYQRVVTDDRSDDVRRTRGGEAGREQAPTRKERSNEHELARGHAPADGDGGGRPADGHAGLRRAEAGGGRRQQRDGPPDRR